MARVEAEKSQETLIGKSAWAVIGEIWRANPQIDTFYFCTIVPFAEPPKDPLAHNPPVAYGELSKSRPLIVLDQTLVGRRVLLELLLGNESLPMLRDKQEGRSPIYSLPKINEARELIRLEREASILCLMSAVKLDDGSFKHIPMIDFSCSGVGHNLEKAREGLRKIGERKGFILNSGNGLHYYGVNLLSEIKRLQFKGRCLLLNLREVRIVDHRNIGHCMIDGYECLRVADYPTKPFVPTIVDIFENLEPPATPETEGDDFLTRLKEWEARRRSGEPLFKF